MKKVLITGASAGIGKAFAEKFATEGYSVTGVARRSKLLIEAIESLKGDGHDFQPADLTKEEDLVRICELIEKNHFDVLINNAGFGGYSHLINQDDSVINNLIELNVKALVKLSKTFLQNAEKGDSLINVSSALGFLPLATQSIYAATKAFVTSFSESMWFEQKSIGVFVMNVCPGPVKTDFFEIAGGDESIAPPPFLFQTPEQVVREVWSHLNKRKSPTLVTGKTKLMVWFTQKFKSRKGLVKMIAGMAAMKDLN